ncbi:MAG: lipoprotein [Clostridia bacterium]|nr:lipoprotein [Clostridia bacterium]
MKKQIAAAMMGMICFGALTACAPQKPADRTIINKDGKQIVVVEDKQSIKEKEVALDKIMSIEGIRVLDWISEDIILIMKDNESMPQIQTEGGLVYPKNFYEYHIKTNEEKLIADSEVNMLGGVLSPDKRHIFYREGVEESLTGFILNRETGKKTQVTKTDHISFYEGRWIDNDTVIFASFPEGKIYTADVNGKITEIPVRQKGMLNNAVKLGSSIYYTTIDGRLYVQEQDKGEKDTKQLGENVLWLIPSPDMTKFAIVKRTAETEMTLYITDLKGKELKTLSKATQIYGTNWSPDGSEIAYSTMNMNSFLWGIFVADTERGDIVQIATDFQNVADPLRWSPSGKQISSTDIKVEETGYKVITNLLQLK